MVTSTTTEDKDKRGFPIALSIQESSRSRLYAAMQTLEHQEIAGAMLLLAQQENEEIQRYIDQADKRLETRTGDEPEAVSSEMKGAITQQIYQQRQAHGMGCDVDGIRKMVDTAFENRSVNIANAVLVLQPDAAMSR